MIKYMSYLFANIRKKWSTYLIPIFATLALAAVLLPSTLTNKTSNPVINNIMVFYYFMPFVFGGMFVGTKALNIFKDGEQDGTELLIVSKPITRGQVVLGKFATLYSLIFAYALWTFIGTLALAYSDTNASTSQILTFAGSFAIGSLIVMMIFSSVITFLASFLGKIATMSLAIIVPAILPIISFIIVPVGGGTINDGAKNYLSNNSAIQMQVDSNGHISTGDTDVKYIYDENHYNAGGDTFASYQTKVQDKQDAWYKYPAYVDVWQHMVGFYSIFQNKVTDYDSQGVQLYDKDLTLTEKNGIALTVDPTGTPTKYLFMPRLEDSYTKTLTDSALVNEFANMVRQEVVNKPAVNALINEPSLDGQISQLKQMFDEGKWNSDYNDKLKQIAPIPALVQYKDEIRSSKKLWSIDGLVATTVAILQNQNKFTTPITSIDQKTLTQDSYQIFAYNQADQNYGTVHTVKVEKYVSTTITIVVYVLIALALAGLVILRYYRRDFK